MELINCKINEGHAGWARTKLSEYLNPTQTFWRRAETGITILS